MSQKKAITVIPATINRFTSASINDVRKRRTAGYARVSTDHEEQQTSYEAQVDYYTNYIKSREDWEFTSVYTDEGISATSTAKRDGFNKMVADALDGKIDLIVTKSVSRFARNTVDSLTTIRKLKEHGTEVYFEKENIWTFDGKGELLITIMSSLAQEESRSISENCTWGQRKRFADGKVCVPYSRFLGYDRADEGGLIINEKEATIIRLIYTMFLEGATPHTIAKHLTAEGILTPGGKSIWSQTTVKAILSNEKYKGDALLQKSYTVDFLTKKKKINEGEIPQYYVENAHEAIIEPVVFEMVQQEMDRRKKGKSRHSGVGMFASRIKCGECGSWYGSKVWHSTSKYRRTIYQCNHKFKGEQKCSTPHLAEETIKGLFISAVNKLLVDKDEIIANFNLVKNELFNTDGLETERSELQNEMAVTAELIQKCIEENARTALDQKEYQERYEGLVARFDTTKARLDEVSELVSDKKARGKLVQAFIDELNVQDGLVTEFDERLWFTLVDYATVYGEDDIRFTFKNGTEVIA
ncbi:MAG: recombinase family protein [Turicibacter sp.]|nr:recombinase family protein [Turicibacter sp.]